MCKPRSSPTPLNGRHRQSRPRLRLRHLRPHCRITSSSAKTLSRETAASTTMTGVANDQRVVVAAAILPLPINDDDDKNEKAATTHPSRPTQVLMARMTSRIWTLVPVLQCRAPARIKSLLPLPLKVVAGDNTLKKDPMTRLVMRLCLITISLSPSNDASPRRLLSQKAKWVRSQDPRPLGATSSVGERAGHMMNNSLIQQQERFQHSLLSRSHP